jgi:ribonucleoside-diphosphate reductase alpha chain
MKFEKIVELKHLPQQVDTYDIEVDADNDHDHNFVVAGMIVHNSNGIEPSFAHHYSRNIIKPGKNTKENVDVWSYEALLYREIFGESVELPDTWGETDNIAPEDHIAIQSAAQKWVDSSISKTINIPTDFDYDKFSSIYMKAYDEGLKGCTTFRFNPAAFQGVLVKKEDLANTEYTFTMEDGNDYTFRGDEVIEFEGEETTAANLYDAVKEGYYGKL